jgi:hypothetical protein
MVGSVQRSIATAVALSRWSSGLNHPDGSVRFNLNLRRIEVIVVWFRGRVLHGVGRLQWLLEVVCALVALLSCGLALYSARDWPIIGDVSLIQYLVFLHGKGMVPYGQTPDVNLPRSYLFETLAMGVFGAGAAGLRWIDASLCLIVALAMAALAGSGWRSRGFGFTAGILFTLLHLQDGALQAEQRDLVMTALVLAATAILFMPAGGASLKRLFCFEVLLGATVAIKPTLAPLALLPLLARQVWAGRKLVAGLVSLAGLSLPILLAAGWLFQTGGWSGFVACMRSIVVLHATLGRRPVGYLLAHCTTPLQWLILVPVGLSLSRSRRIPVTPRRRALWLGLLVSFGSYLAQGKGFPYHRYPLLAFLLLLCFLSLGEAMEDRGWRRLVASAGLAALCLWVAPLAVARIRSYDRASRMRAALKSDLMQAGVVDGDVQCLDTFPGCANVLLTLNRVQATGFLYDCYLFSDEVSLSGAYREAFLRAFDAARPRVVVMMGQDCFQRDDAFARIDRWPALRERLAREYGLRDAWSSAEPERWWSRTEVPARFRVYERR